MHDLHIEARGSAPLQRNTFLVSAFIWGVLIRWFALGPWGHMAAGLKTEAPTTQTTAAETRTGESAIL